MKFEKILTDRQTDRIEWLDLAKGIGIILVILGHMQVNTLLHDFIYTFHMPLFILISGIFFKGSKLCKSVKKLLICYFSMSFLTTLIYYLIFFRSKNLSVKSFFWQILSIFLGGSAPHFRVDASPAVWFFTALVVIQVIATLQEKYIKKLSIIVPIICAILGLLLSKIKNDSYIPYNFDVALLLYPFFVIGGLIKKDNIINRLLLLSKINLIITDIVLFVLTFVISYFNKEVNIYRCNYGNNILLYYLGGVFGTMMIIVTSIVISKIMTPKFLIWLGKNTVVPMCTNNIILMGTPILFSLVGLSNIYWIIKLLIEFAIVMIFVIVFTILINKCCPFLLGQESRHKIRKNSMLL